MVDIEQIIIAVMEQGNISILKNNKKNNKKNNAVVEYFMKNYIIKDDKISTLSQIPLEQLFNPPFQENGLKFGFEEKDSLYLLSQNEISDTIKLPKSILKKSNTLTIKESRNNFYSKKSFYEFNLPIISKDKTKAYLQVGYFCGWNCGGGTAYFLQKQNGKWLVVNKWTVWIS